MYFVLIGCPSSVLNTDFPLICHQIPQDVQDVWFELVTTIGWNTILM